MAAEQGPQSGLGHRGAGARAAQHHEALRGAQPGRSLVAQVGAGSAKNTASTGTQRSRPPLPIAHAAPALVDVFEEQAADLGRAQPAQQHGQHHRPVPVGGQAGQERLDVGQLKGLGQPALFADQPSAAAGPSRAEVAQHAARGRAQARPRRGAGTGLAGTTPLIIRCSKNARTAATRRLIVAGAAPGRARRTTLELLPGARTPCQSTHANTSIGATSASGRPCSDRNRAKLATSKAYAGPWPARTTGPAGGQGTRSHQPSGPVARQAVSDLLHSAP